MAIELDTEFVCLLPAGGYQIALLYDGGLADQFPALGFMVMRVKTHDKKSWVHSIHPISAEMVHDFDSQSYVLIRPDGKVDEPEMQTYASLDAFLASRKSNADTKSE